MYESWNADVREPKWSSQGDIHFESDSTLVLGLDQIREGKNETRF